MPTIRRLDPALVNKIAAGEVIERPASVVKELVENALDSGATQIDLVLEEGGATLISVSDNGCGITADELPLALAPHATSKIRDIDDLSAILTMGFRGEALASISSVSRMKIVSRAADASTGACVLADEHGVEDRGTCAAPPGTTIEVRNLFYNVPARRKYLRSSSAEVQRVGEQLARMALPHPNVGFTQVHDGRRMRTLPPTDDLRGRIADFFGAELARDLIPIKREEPGLRIEGFFAPPAQSKASTRWQYTFLNGRFIKDAQISGFVFREAFRGLMMPSRFPVVFLFLQADPHSFDVNVHPTKIEVRWRDAGRVKSQVLAVLREALLSRDLTPSMGRMRGGEEFRPAQTPAEFAARLQALPTDDSDDSPLDGVDGVASADGVDRFGSGDTARRESPSQRGGDQLWKRDPFRPAPSLEDWSRMYAPPSQQRTARREDSDPGASHQNRKPTNDSDAADAADPAEFAGEAASHSTGTPNDRAEQRFDVGQDVDQHTDHNIDHDGSVSSAVESFSPDLVAQRAMQIHNMYLVCETDEGMVVIDQHALHERILFEQISTRIRRGKLESQQLLLPETFDVTPAQMAAVEEASELLTSLGLEIVPFGPRSVAVSAAPSLLRIERLHDFVSDLLDRLEGDGDHSTEALLNDLVATMACKAAVKAGDPLSQELIEALMSQRHLVDRSSNCPHGRPTALRLTMGDLERQFKRR